MKDKSIRIIVKFPRTRISDSCRLVFPPDTRPDWYPVGSFPKIQPPYKIPREVLRGKYNIILDESRKMFIIDLDTLETYDDMVLKLIQEINKIYNNDNTVDLSRHYLYGVQFNKNKTASLLIDYI